MPEARTFFDKVWDAHVVTELGDGQCLVAVDRVFLHELTGGQSMQMLERSGRPAARPRQVFATIDHSVSTRPGRGPLDWKSEWGREMMPESRRLAARFGFHFFDVGDPSQGITHVIATESGAALPGSTVVVSDSHATTIGGIGALAWGIGTAEGEHVLATQALYQARPRTMRVSFEGRVGEGVSAKDLVLHLIGRIGAQGGIGHAVEFAGPVVRGMPVEQRLTLCNMSLEFSARYGFVPPDDATYQYLAGRDFAPGGAAWDRALAHWRTLPGDDGAAFDRELTVDCGGIAPQVTWGVSPQSVAGIDGAVPDPARESDTGARALIERGIAYMGLAPGTPLAGIPIDAAYIGSCTNARLSDLREAARVLRGRRVAEGVLAVCIPGSTRAKREAEAEGIDQVFKAAGFDWREAGCGSCAGAGEFAFAGRRIVSTTARNFENRQGVGARTHLASPATVAASAVAGRLADPRPLLV